MREPWRSIHLLLSCWAWLMVFVSLFPLFPWRQQVLPAFHKMLAGEHFSCLRISTTRIVYRIWPYAEIRVVLEQVAGLKRDHWLGDRLILQDAAVIGISEFAMTPGQIRIPLSSFSGWPTGRCSALLCAKFIPKIIIWHRQDRYNSLHDRRTPAN